MYINKIYSKTKMILIHTYNSKSVKAITYSRSEKFVKSFIYLVS